MGGSSPPSIPSPSPVWPYRPSPRIPSLPASPIIALPPCTARQNRRRAPPWLPSSTGCYSHIRARGPTAGHLAPPRAPLLPACLLRFTHRFCYQEIERGVPQKVTPA
uniref:Uncharacterized protein n=1 Tax=Setaria italica TaxID=4555 RepID=K3ZB08_SETIT